MVALIAVLLRTGLTSAEKAIMEAMLLSLCLNLFISYPFNSILHHKVGPHFSLAQSHALISQFMRLLDSLAMASSALYGNIPNHFPVIYASHLLLDSL